MPRDLPEGYYRVIGPPGCGKTTFLERWIKDIMVRYSGHFAASRWPQPVLVCSLTRAAAAEVAGRDTGVPKSAVGTLHAHCYRALGAPPLVGPADIAEWNESSPWTIAGDEFTSKDDPDWDRMIEADRPEQSGDQMLQELDLARHRLAPTSSFHRDLAAFAEDWRAFKAERGVIDFTDMIEHALDQGLGPPGEPAVILVDEAQDLSALEIKLVQHWRTFARALMIVGDPWQSLYVWRGADPSIFTDESIAPDHTHLLSQSYRVPAKVVHVASSWMRDHLSTYQPIEYSPRKHDPELDEHEGGDVSIAPHTIDDCESLVDEIQPIIEEGRTVMVQASCSYMLNSLLARLRHVGLPFSNPWRSSKSGWNSLGVSRGSIANRTKALMVACEDNPDRDRASWRTTLSWAEHLKAKDRYLRGRKAAFASFVRDLGEAGGDEPTAEVLMEFFEREFAEDVVAINEGVLTCEQALTWWVRQLLPEHSRMAESLISTVERFGVNALFDPPRVFVGTIHSFKGAQADVVYVFPDLSAAGFREWVAGGEQRDSVVRLFYVAMTRARERLVICSPSDRNTAPLRREIGAYAEELRRGCVGGTMVGRDGAV
jgi:DNA helicase-2/ATP-dependent DNA helicase PcrA